MADWEDSLNSLLNDPDAMGQILSLAEKLGGTDQNAPTQDTPPLFSSSDIGRLLSFAKECGGTDGNTAALLAALRPFLQEKNRQTLDKAQRLAVLSKVALKLWRDGEFHL